MAFCGKTDASSSMISYTWTIPRLFSLDHLLYSESFESEPDICWQAVFEQCSDGTKKCGLKYLGCSVLGPVFPVEVEFGCYAERNTCMPVINPIIKIFDSIMDEHREIVPKDNSSRIRPSLYLEYRITARKYANFAIPRSRLLRDLPPTNKSLTGIDFKYPECPSSSKAHMEVLASRSSVFAAMFNVDMMEKRQKSITITDIHSAVFKQLLQFIYTDKAQPDNMMVAELLAAAEKYDLARLKAACERALFRVVKASTAIKTLIFADKHNAQQLKNHTLDFIVANADSVLRNGWETLVGGQPQLLLDVSRAMANK